MAPSSQKKVLFKAATLSLLALAPLTLVAGSGEDTETGLLMPEAGTRIEVDDVFENDRRLGERVGVYEEAITVDYVFSSEDQTRDEARRIGLSSWVGIGTDRPTSNLEIVSDQVPQLELTEIGGGSLIFDQDSEVSNIKALGVDPSAGGGQLAIFTNGEERLRVNEAGAVGIGTDSPKGLLHVHRSAGSSNYIHISNEVGGPGQSGGMYIGSSSTGNAYVMNERSQSLVLGTADQEFMRIRSSGKVGIGTETPAYTLDVNGIIRAENLQEDSDARFKVEVVTLHDALSRISELRGVSFYWEDPARSSDLQVGLIAQEVEAVFPEVVSTDADGYKSVAYSKLVAPLIEATKAQQDRIEALEGALEVATAERAAQAALLSALSDRLSQLEAGRPASR